MVEQMMAGVLAFIAVAMVATATVCILLAHGYKDLAKQAQAEIKQLLQHQRQLVLAVKARDATEAEVAITRSLEPAGALTVPAAAAPVIKAASDPVPIKDEAGRVHQIRFIGLDPQAEADARDELINGDS